MAHDEVAHDVADDAHKMLERLGASGTDGQAVIIIVSSTPTVAPGTRTRRPGRRAADTAGRREALILRRQEVCKTQEGLAVDIGVDRSTIARWEAGETTPSLWAKPKLAVALGITLDALAVLLEIGPA
jgi:DNA-binding XRE family transcriptional regulator